MNVFFHGTIEAGFDVLKAKIERDMAGEMGKWISEYRLSDLGNKEVMCALMSELTFPKNIKKLADYR